MALLRVELRGWSLHLEVGRAESPAPQDEPPFHIAPPMQVYAPEYVGFLPPTLEPFDKRRTP